MRIVLKVFYRVGVVVTCQSHKLELVGSIPTLGNVLFIAILVLKFNQKNL